MSRRTQPIGKTFGRLTVMAVVRRGWIIFWRCRCRCGRKVTVRAWNVRQGRSWSCGCLKRDRAATQGGAAHDPAKRYLYEAWRRMLVASGNTPNARAARRHGPPLCQRWRGPRGFRNFLKDVGERPTREHRLLRRNPHRGYSPSNCRWGVGAAH